MANPTIRNSKQILIATKAFASEKLWVSWSHLLIAIGIYLACLSIAVFANWLPLQIFASIVSGLVIVRLFIIYHDYQHGAILKRSRIAQWIMNLFGILVLSPPSAWNRSHDHHHKHNSRHSGTNIGAYPLLNTIEYAGLTPGARFLYIVARHPLTMLCGYFTVFFYGMCLRAFVLGPRESLDAGIAVVLHVGLLIGFAMAGMTPLLLGIVLPMIIACALGSYLFYAQHNFPTCKLLRNKDWNVVDAALLSSSHMKMGWLMNWFTGNVGFHHIHHLNAKIPFYRLPETMRSIKELQQPGYTSLQWRDIRDCLRLKLWDEDKGRLVSFREARASASSN